MYASQDRKVAEDNVSAIKEEHRVDISGMIVSENSQKAMKRNKVSGLDSTVCVNDYDIEKQETRSTSPLDTIAEVACRLGTRLPLIARRGSNERSLPANAFRAVSVAGCQEHGNDSPKSIPTQETTSPAPPTSIEKGGALGHEVSVCLHSLLSILGNHKVERVSNGSYLEKKVNKSGGNERTKKRQIVQPNSEDMGTFKDVVMTTLEKISQEIYKVKADVASLQKAIECIQRERGCGQSCEGQGETVTIRPEDVGKVWLIVRRGENCEAEKGNECGGKRERKSDDWMSPESEAEGGSRKKMKNTVTGKELRQRMERSESMTGTESICNSGKSDWDYTESGNKRLRRDGVGGGGSKGKITKRRRDNWTEEENKVFMSMVLGSQEVEEMTLRRMLARRFSPRRTHEQCANHLRILRAQKKLPPAREESGICVMKKDK